MPHVNRRDVIKTMAVTGSAAVIPFTAQAMSASLFPGAAKTKALNTLPLYIDVMLGQTRAKQQTQIKNDSDAPITVTQIEPSSFSSVNGQVTVSVKTPQLPYTLQPGESLPVYAQADSPNSARSSIPVVPTIASETLSISTADAAMNGELIVSVFDSQFI